MRFKFRLWGLVISSLLFVSSALANVVGTLNGQAGVSPSGAATYTIPIEVPPSLSGLQPSLALTYNSQARHITNPVKLSQINPGVGSMGQGWSISGLSAISRCQTDLTRDGYIDAVDYDSNDQFCLDGQRLILVSGSHGATGAEYKAEINGNAKVVVASNSGYGPTSFKIVSSNGQVSKYGFTDDSRQEAHGRNEIDRWNISKIEKDERVNIDFHYEKNTSDNIYRISAINYESKSLKFVYELIDSEHLLRLIEIKQNGNLESSYEISYENAGAFNRAFVDNVVYCSNENCLRPDLFEWSGLDLTVNFTSARKAIGSFGYNAGSWRTDKHPRMMSDINGDGLADIVGFASSGVITALSNGDGTFASARTAIRSFGYNAGGWRTNMHPRMMADVNGDGLADIVGFASSGVITALSNGDGTFASARTAIRSFGYNAGGWRTNMHPRMMADINGDGLADIVGFASAGVYTSSSSYLIDGLKSVNSGFGKTTFFDLKFLKDSDIYKKLFSASYPATPFQGQVSVVSKLETDNGQGGTNSTSYFYEGMRIHKRGLGNLGFNKITKTNNQTGIKSITEYSQDYTKRLIGNVKTSKTITPSGIAISSSANYWESEKAYNGTYQVKLRKTVSQNKELDGSNTYKNETTYCVTDSADCTAYSTSYDQYGNPLIINTTVTDQQNGYETYTTKTINEYWPLNTFATSSDYFTSQKKRVTVTKGGSNRVSKTRVAEFNEYYANGKLKKETVEPGANQLVTQYEYETSGYGRITKKTVSGANIATRSSSITYDANNPYLSTSRNALNQTTITKLSPKWGTILSKTNANGFTVYNTYDDFGRKSSETLPDGSKVVYSYDWCSSSSCPAGAVYSHTATTTDGLSENYSKTFFDALQRKVAVSTLGFDGEEIRVDYLYDELGRQYKTSLPYFVGTGSAVYKENTGYDLLNRVTEVTHPNSSTSSIAYDGLETTYTNAKNQQKVMLKNALGETILSTDDDYKQLSLTYDALGNLISTRDEAGNSVIMNYDIRGNKTSMNDPDKGQWEYEYNVLGQLVLQTDAKNQSTCMVYDVLGRMTKRIDQYLAGNSNHSSRIENALSGCTGDGSNTQISHWVYDTSPVKGVGKLHAVSGANGYAKTFTYDALGRVSNKAITIGGKTHNVGKTYYANTSKVNAMIYPTFNGSEFKLRNFYKPTGALYKTQDISGGRIGEVYWQATGMNASGQLTNFVLGNGVTTTNTYNEHTGFIEEIDSLKAGITGIQYLDYRYDEIGNLEHRKDFIKGLSEQFGYDELNRLTGSTITGTDAQGTAFREDEVSSYDNNGLGNIQSKTGVGIYSYGQPNAACSVNFAGPHAVTSITGGSTQATTSYCYDENGNMVSGAGRNISYTAFGKPSLMTKGSNRVEFVYGPNRTRIQRVDNNKTTTTYVEGIYEELETSGGLTGKYYIGNYAVVTKDASSVNTNYLHRDHLGSVDAITNANGVPVAGQKMSFDAWGKRRQARWNAMSTLELFNFNAQITKRGYTNHEQVDSMGLIHMNGRVYDPILARFISADPIIQAPLDMQSYNRYSYVRNNPLAYTDPTGYSWLEKKLKQVGNTIEREAVDLFISTVSAAFGPVGQAYGYYHGTKNSQIYRMGSSIVAGYADKIGCAGLCSSANSYLQVKILGGSDKDALTSAGFSYLNHMIFSGSKIEGATDIAKRGITAGALGVAKNRMLGGEMGNESVFWLSMGGRVLGDSMQYYIESNNPNLQGSAEPTQMPGFGVDKVKGGLTTDHITSVMKSNVGKTVEFDALGNPIGQIDWQNETSIFMQSMSKIPGMNYMAAFHDTWVGEMGWTSFMGVTGTIPLAMVPVYGQIAIDQKLKNNYMDAAIN